jgi:hypothetical protein
MASGMKRLSGKARHLIHRLRGEKHVTVQRTMVHELKHEIDRQWGTRRRVPSIDPGAPGRHRPLSGRAKAILTRLRKTRVWSVQKQLVAELTREIEKPYRKIRKVIAAAKLAAERARRAAELAQRAGRNTARASKAAYRAARKAGLSTREASRVAGKAVRWTATRARRAGRWARDRRNGHVRVHKPRRGAVTKRASQTVAAQRAAAARSTRNPVRAPAGDRLPADLIERDRHARAAKPARTHRYEHAGVKFTSDRKLSKGDVEQVAREARRAQSAKADGRLADGQAYRSATSNGKRVADNLPPKPGRAAKTPAAEPRARTPRTPRAPAPRVARS